MSKDLVIGYYGSGFTVVEEEIRKLSEQSNYAVNVIKGKISNIQEGTKKVSVTAKMVENVLQLQEDAVDNTIKSYEDINNNVEQLVLNLSNIMNNVENIEKSRSNTLEAIENVSAVLEERAASYNTINQTAYEQLHTIENLNQAVTNLNK